MLVFLASFLVAFVSVVLIGTATMRAIWPTEMAVVPGPKLLLQPGARTLLHADAPSFEPVAIGDAVIVTNAAEPAAEVPAPQPVLFHLGIPFRSQLDGAAYQGTNCGPTSFAMVLEAFGVPQKNADVRWRAHVYQGTPNEWWWGTGLEHLGRVARDFDLKTIGLDGPNLGKAGTPSKSLRWHTWTTDAIREQLAQGHPLIVLTKFRLLPGHEEAALGDDHYIVVHGIGENGFIYNDPIYREASDGVNREISESGLRRAMAEASIPFQALAFAAGPQSSLTRRAA